MRGLWGPLPDDPSQNHFVFKAPPPRFENLESYPAKGLVLTAMDLPVGQFSFLVEGAYLFPSPGDLPYAPRKIVTPEFFILFGIGSSSMLSFFELIVVISSMLSILARSF